MAQHSAAPCSPFVGTSSQLGTPDRSARRRSLRPAAKRALARAAAGAVPHVAARCEPLESRRLLAVTFDFHFNDPGKTYRKYYDRIEAAMEAAGEAWASHLEGTSKIEVEIQIRSRNIDPTVGDALAAARPAVYELVGNDPDDGPILQTGPLFEIATGASGTAVDPNGADPDAFVLWTAEALDEALFSTERRRVVGDNQFDAVTIATHELGHVLGFTSRGGLGPFTDEATGNFGTTSFGQQLIFAPGVGVAFGGDAAQSVYGGPVPIDTQSFAHYGGRFESDDLRNNLMFFAARKGVIFDISALDLAILADSGLPVIDTFPETPTSGPVLEITGTSASDVIEVINTGSEYVIRKNFVVQTGTFPVADFDSVTIDGLGGNDRIILSGTFPSVSISGGDGDDTIFGSGGNDTLDGGSGFDRIFGAGGADLILGGSGQDRLFGEGGDDRIFGGNQNDYIDGGVGNDFLDGGGHDDFITAVAGHDELFGGKGNDLLSGGSGNDTMQGGEGGDYFAGGAGTDTVDLTEKTEDLVVRLDGLANDGAAGEGDNVAGSNEIFRLGSGNDRFQGDALVNYVYGNEGNDLIAGGDGNDYIEGGSGADRLDGQGGDDSVLGGGGNDRIVGGVGRDRLFGEAGNDLFYSLDRFVDSLEGGDGNDLFDDDDKDILDSIEGLIA